MKTPLTARIAAAVLSAGTTLVLVVSIAAYAYPDRSTGEKETLAVACR